jgi:Flavin reductase like domain
MHQSGHWKHHQTWGLHAIPSSGPTDRRGRHRPGAARRREAAGRAGVPAVEREPGRRLEHPAARVVDRRHAARLGPQDPAQRRVAAAFDVRAGPRLRPAPAGDLRSSLRPARRSGGRGPAAVPRGGRRGPRPVGGRRPGVRRRAAARGAAAVARASAGRPGRAGPVVAWLECDLERTVDCGDHATFVGAVLAAGCDESRDSLVFYDGQFHSIATPPPARFPPPGPPGRSRRPARAGDGSGPAAGQGTGDSRSPARRISDDPWGKPARSYGAVPATPPHRSGPPRRRRTGPPR